MHEIDYDLLQNVEQYLKKDFIKREIKKHLRDTLAKYKMACKLSNGPDISRSKYWASEARSIEIKLAEAFNSKKTSKSNKTNKMDCGDI